MAPRGDGYVAPLVATAGCPCGDADVDAVQMHQPRQRQQQQRQQQQASSSNHSTRQAATMPPAAAAAAAPKAAAAAAAAAAEAAAAAHPPSAGASGIMATKTDDKFLAAPAGAPTAASGGASKGRGPFALPPPLAMAKAVSEGDESKTTDESSSSSGEEEMEMEDDTTSCSGSGGGSEMGEMPTHAGSSGKGKQLSERAKARAVRALSLAARRLRQGFSGRGFGPASRSSCASSTSSSSASSSASCASQQQEQQPKAKPKAKPRKYQHVQLPHDRLRPYLEQHGERSMAYGHLHPCQKHFEVPGLGVVSYVWVRSVLGRVAFVTTDPLAAPEDMAALLQRFHAEVPGMKQYVAVSQAVADALPASYSRTVFARDYYGDFKQWKAPKSRRRYLNEGRNAGLAVEELTEAELTPEEKARVEEISRRWLGRKTGFGRELQLLTHPFKVEDEWAIRKFYCFDKPRAQGGRLLAYIFFTPCFRGGRVVGYNANILRRDPTLTEKPGSYVLDFLLLHCEQRFRQEAGIEFLSLSFSPLYGLEPCEGDSPMLRRTFQMWYKMPSRLYAKKSLGQHKDHFKLNRVEKVYACARGLRGNLAIQDLVLTCTNLIPVARSRHGLKSD